MLCAAKSVFIVGPPGKFAYSRAIKTLGFNYLTLWKCVLVGGVFIYSTPNQRLEMWLLIILTVLCGCVLGGELGQASAKGVSCCFLSFAVIMATDKAGMWGL